MENMMKSLNHWIRILPEEFNGMTEFEIASLSLPNKWSEKEILGHLCDSAINNISKKVRSLRGWLKAYF
ncbi:MAG: hypothetical protein Q8934_14455 [Bacillota bacterium]|nr:hypothetical protein [Bacillota bacterium]